MFSEDVLGGIPMDSILENVNYSSGSDTNRNRVTQSSVAVEGEAGGEREFENGATSRKWKYFYVR